MRIEPHSLADASRLPLFAHDHSPSRLSPARDRDHVLGLRQRLLRHGASTLDDTELLELLLAQVTPRGQERKAARQLRASFGSLGHILAAPVSKLQAEVGDQIAAQIKLIEAGGERMAQSEIRDRPLISSWDALLHYGRAMLSNRSVEEFHVLYLDRRNMLISDEILGRGTVDHVPVYPREVLKRALELDACAMILLHNHPSGDPTPSDSDIAMTRRIHHAAESLSITLHDHVIIGAGREVSMKGAGLMD